MPFIPKSTGIPTVDRVFKEVFAILNRFQGGKVASSSDEPVDWADIVNKPTTFPPESHTQDISTINNLQTALDGKQPVHANLTSISNLSTTPSGRFLVTNGSAIVARPLQNSDLPAIAITDTFVVSSQAAMLALSAAERGDVAVRTDLNKSFILKGDNPASLSDWQELLTPTDAVLSVDGRTGVVSLSDKYQPLDTDLTTIAGLTHSNRHVMVSNGSSWTRRALEEADLPSLSAAKITSGTLDNARLSFNPNYFVQGTNNRRMILVDSTNPLASNEFCTFFRMENTDPAFDSRLTGGVGLGLKVINYSTLSSFELMGQASGNGVILFGGTDNAGNRHPWKSIWHSGNFNPDNYQPLNTYLTAIAGLTPTARNVIIGTGTTWTRRALEEADLPSLSISKITNLQDTLDDKASLNHTHTSLLVPDTREVATTTSDYPRALKVNFKRNSTIGLSGGGTYSTVLGVFGWNDPSGGAAHELAFGSNGIYSRFGIPGNDWGLWRRILTTADNPSAIGAEPAISGTAYKVLSIQSDGSGVKTGCLRDLGNYAAIDDAERFAIIHSTDQASISFQSQGSNRFWISSAPSVLNIGGTGTTVPENGQLQIYYNSRVVIPSLPLLVGKATATTGNPYKIEVEGNTLVTGYTASIYPSNSSVYYRDVYQFSTNTASFAGTMKITLPKSWSSTMLTFTIKGYNYNYIGAWECVISGYNYSVTPGWYNCSAEIRGSAPFSEVRLAHDGTKCCLLLGTPNTIWSYPQVAITEVFASYQNTSGWGEPYSMEFITGEDGITNIVTPLVNSGVGADWNALINKPSTFTPSTHGHPWGDITGKPSVFAPAAHGLVSSTHTVSGLTAGHVLKATGATTYGFAAIAWSEITGKPSTFAPAAHGLVSSTHTVSGLTAGHVLKATGATTYGFAALTPSEIGAPAIGTERSLSVTTAGWVTIATCATGRAYGEFHVYDSTGSRHNFTKIIASTSYGENNVSVIGGNRFYTRTIAHVRILYNTSDRTYGGAKLQVYCENPTFTLYVKQFLSQEFTNWKAWNNVTPVAEGTPTGWAQDDSTYLQDITNPNYSFIGNVFSGKELLLSGNATISGNTAFGKTTFVGGNRIEVAGGALIEGKLTGRNALEIWGHSYLGNNLNVGGLLSFMYDGNYVTFAGRNVSNTVDLLNIAKINDMNVFDRGFYVNDGNMSIYGNRVNMSRRNVGGAATINITTNPQIIDLNDYPGVSRFDITTNMSGGVDVYLKNAVPGDEIFLKIVKTDPYPSQYDIALGWNIDTDGTWMRYATKRYFHLICEGTTTAGGITANTWWIAGVHGLYNP